MIDLNALVNTWGPAVVGITGRGRGGGRDATGTVIGDGLVVTTAHNTAGNTSRKGRPHRGRGGRTDGSGGSQQRGPHQRGPQQRGPQQPSQQRPRVRVQFGDGREEEGTVAGLSEQMDLAVVTVDTGDIAPLQWGDSTALGAGTEIAALAAPGGQRRITPGTIAAVDSRLRTRTGSPVDQVFEHTAALVRGASGGPVLDGDGKVLGVNVNRLEGGLYQAVAAAEDLRATVTRLAEGDEALQPRLGVTIVPDRQAREMRAAVGLPPVDGALVADVEEDSPAAAAGLKRGDLIVSAADQPLRSGDDLLLALRHSGPQLSLEIMHSGTQRRAVTVSLT